MIAAQNLATMGALDRPGADARQPHDDDVDVSVGGARSGLKRRFWRPRS